jgi:type II secretion system protein N
MRLPRLRLPRPRLSFEWVGALGGRTTLLYVGYTLTLFLGFLLVTFPHEQLVKRALKNTLNRAPVEVDFKSLNLGYDGYEIAGAYVAPATGEQTPYLELSRLWVRPSLAALVRGNPYDVLISADLYGGEARGELNAAAGGLTGLLKLQGVDIGRYRTVTSLLDEGQLSGKLSGQFNFETRASNLSAGQGNGDVSIDGASLTGAKVNGFPIPDLKLRQVRAKFQVRTGHVEIQELQTTGDINAQGSGQISLRDPVRDSVLNLRATIVTGLETPDTIKALVALIPRQPGAKPDAPITITGTLASPRVR